MNVKHFPRLPNAKLQAVLTNVLRVWQTCESYLNADLQIPSMSEWVACNAAPDTI